jgi:RimJ/RimL family protein N-acetyltransferase
MSPVVRPATVADAPAIAAVQVVTWQAAYAGLLPADYLAGMSRSVEQRAQRWRTTVTTGESTVLVIEADEANEAGPALAGFAAVGPSRDDDATADIGELIAIYVDPAHWARGLGSSLHNAGMAVLQAGGHQRATLWVLDTNARSRGFYERHGWHADGETKRQEIGGVTVTEVRYATHLVR